MKFLATVQIGGAADDRDEWADAELDSVVQYLGRKPLTRSLAGLVL